MKLFTYGVSGASPGLGGMIIIVAGNRKKADALAAEEIIEINANRSAHNQRPVTLDEDVQVDPFETPMIVHSYDGEA